MSETTGVPTVLYITGWTRSGSTLLGNVLGEVPGVLHVGELHYLWQNGIARAGTNTQCGCGLAVTECEHWSSLIKAADQDSTALAEQMMLRQHGLLRTRHTLTRLSEALGRRPVPAALEQAVDRTVALYRLLAQRGGERLIVDSSKFPAEAAALLGRTDVRTRVLHLVRDPRPTAVSYQQAKDYIDPMNPARSSAYWAAFNLASEAVGRVAGSRYLRLRHEDLCASPRASLRKVMDFAGLDEESPVDAEGGLNLGTNHTVTGNPDRLRAGRTIIRADERWRSRLSPTQSAAATGPALALLARYGYPLQPRLRGQT